MEDRASNARKNKSDSETIKKLEIDLALMKEKLRLETEKVKSSNYHPREEIKKDFN